MGIETPGNLAQIMVTHSLVEASLRWLTPQCFAYIHALETGQSKMHASRTLTDTNYNPALLNNSLQAIGVTFLSRELQDGVFRIVTAEDPFLRYGQFKLSFRDSLLRALNSLPEVGLDETKARDILVTFAAVCKQRYDTRYASNSDIIVCIGNIGHVIHAGRESTLRAYLTGSAAGRSSELMPDLGDPGEVGRRKKIETRDGFIKIVNAAALAAQARISKFKHANSNAPAFALDNEAEPETEPETEFLPEADLEPSDEVIRAIENEEPAANALGNAKSPNGEKHTNGMALIGPDQNKLGASQEFVFAGITVSEQLQSRIMAEKILRTNEPVSQSIDTILASLGLLPEQIEQLTYQVADRNGPSFKATEAIVLSHGKRQLELQPNQVTQLKLWVLGHSEITIAGLLALDHSTQDRTIMRLIYNLDLSKLSEAELKDLLKQKFSEHKSEA